MTTIPAAIDMFAISPAAQADLLAMHGQRPSPPATTATPKPTGRLTAPLVVILMGVSALGGYYIGKIDTSPLEIAYVTPAPVPARSTPTPIAPVEVTPIVPAPSTLPALPALPGSPSDAVLPSDAAKPPLAGAATAAPVPAPAPAGQTITIPVDALHEAIKRAGAGKRDKPPQVIAKPSNKSGNAPAAVALAARWEDLPIEFIAADKSTIATVTAAGLTLKGGGTIQVGGTLPSTGEQVLAVNPPSTVITNRRILSITR